MFGIPENALDTYLIIIGVVLAVAFVADGFIKNKRNKR